MECEDVHAHLADYVAGSLSGETAHEVNEHLRHCAACAAEVEGLPEIWQMLGTLPADRAPSAPMRARLDNLLESGNREPGAGNREPGTRSPHPAWLAAAAMLLLAVGVGLGRLSVPSPAGNPEIAVLRDEIRALREMAAIAMLQQSSPSERLKGVSWTSRLEDPGSELAMVLLDTLMRDPNVNVRLAAIDALKRFGDREAVRRGALEALTRQSSPLVQIALIDFAAEVNGAAAAETLRRLAGDPQINETVRARAAAVLQKVG